MLPVYVDVAYEKRTKDIYYKFMNKIAKICAEAMGITLKEIRKVKGNF